MTNNKSLSSWSYRISTAASLILIILLSWITNDLVEVWIYVVIAFLVVESAVFIKDYKQDECKLFELLQSCVAPLYVFFILNLAKSTGLMRKTITTLGIVLLISFIYIGIMFTVNIISRRKLNNTGYIKKVIAIGLYRVRSLLLIALAVQMLYMTYVSSVQHNSIQNETQVVKAWSEERTIAGHYETLRVLNNEDEFANITDPDRRYEVFVCAVDVESNYLGVPYEITVNVGNLDEGIAAQYCDTEKTITIDENYLMGCTAENLIKSAAHECWHAYQYQLIRLYEKVKDDEESLIFLDGKLEYVKEYINEFKDYKTCDDSIEAYATQYCEKDSYLYAETSYEKWIERLEEIEESEG